MRILLCHNDYRLAGGERAAVESQAALLTTHGHQVVRLTRDNSEIDEWGLGRKLSFPFDTVHSRRTARQVGALVGAHRPDVAHVHNVFPLLSPSLYRSLSDLGVPIVQTVHNYRFLCPNGLFFTHEKPCERCKSGNTLPAVGLRCYRNSYTLSAIYATAIGLHRRWGTFERIGRFLALTEFVAAKLVEGGFAAPNRVRVVGNFLPEPLPEPVEPRRPPYLVYLGRLSYEKGVDLLLEAMTGLPRFRLLVCGEGPQEADLRRRAEELGLSNVTFTGFVSGQEKRDLLAHAWVTVVPSRWYEVFPFAVLESLAHGVPVVVSRHGSLAALVGEGRRGLSFRPGDVGDLQATLSSLLADPSLRERMATRGRLWVWEEFRETVHYERLMSIYQEVTA